LFCIVAALAPYAHERNDSSGELEFQLKGRSENRHSELFDLIGNLFGTMIASCAEIADFPLLNQRFSSSELGV
jgi:hypothetical protein